MPIPTPLSVRRTCALAMVCLLLACTAPGARADDPTPEQVQARAIGRDLLSADAKVRARALSRLLARLQRGGDVEPFVRDVADAARAWADKRERLMERWLEQAVNGRGEKREEAVRLLAALGADAVRRLAEEVRRARGTKGASGSGSGSEESKKASAGDADEPTLTPRIYDLHDLLAGGMSRLRVLGLIRKASDASDVKSLPGGVYIVTARETGHSALQIRLDALRGPTQDAGGVHDADRADAGDRPQEAGASPQAPASPPPPHDDGPTAPDTTTDPLPTAPAAAPRKTAAADTRTWRVSATILHVPWRAVAPGGAYPGKAGEDDMPTGFDRRRPEVRVGSQEQVQTWTAGLRRLPDARQAPEAKGSPLLSATTPASLASGTPHSYARSLTRTKGGAWRVVMDSILQGFELEIHASPSGDELGLHVVASRTDIGLPMPVDQVRPAPDAAPVTLERPEWTTTRAHARFALPATGGGALLSLGGLATETGDHVLVLLLVTPSPAK